MKRENISERFESKRDCVYVERASEGRIIELLLQL